MKTLLPFLILLLAGCTTTRPLTKQDKAIAAIKHQRDTLMMKPVVVNNPVETKIIVRRDTLVIEKNTHTEAMLYVLDTVKLANMMQEWRTVDVAEIKDLKITILALDKLIQESAIGASAMQAKLTTSEKKQIAAQELKETNEKVVFQFPLYIYGALLFVALIVAIVIFISRIKLKILKRASDRK
jgi:hypothetical protein